MCIFVIINNFFLNIWVCTTTVHCKKSAIWPKTFFKDIVGALSMWPAKLLMLIFFQFSSSLLHNAYWDDWSEVTQKHNVSSLVFLWQLRIHGLNYITYCHSKSTPGMGKQQNKALVSYLAESLGTCLAVLLKVVQNGMATPFYVACLVMADPEYSPGVSADQPKPHLLAVSIVHDIVFFSLWQATWINFV